jgi:hypothetical protein
VAKMKPTLMWAVVCQDGIVRAITRTRFASRVKASWQEGPGDRVARVRVTEVPPTPRKRTARGER